MKFSFCFLLLVSLSTLQTCYNSSDHDILDDSEEHDDLVEPVEPVNFNDMMSTLSDTGYSDVGFNDMDVPIERAQMLPDIAVYQQVKDRGDFIVMCRSTDWIHGISSELSVESEHKYTMRLMGCLRGMECFLKVTVSPPASFTCVHKISDIYYWRSETYNYREFGNLDSDHHEKGVSLFYICFVSIIAVCLMITAVIAITIMSNSKEPIKNDYENA